MSGSDMAAFSGEPNTLQYSSKTLLRRASIISEHSVGIEPRMNLKIQLNCPYDLAAAAK